MAETREALREIGRLCGALPEEVEHRGVEGEAMFLLGPVADPEAWGHHEASVRAGRVSPDYLADAIGDSHPVWVLGTWEMLWRAELEHDDAELVALAAAVDYLDRTMSYMATWPHLPFEDFARDLRRCLRHLEAVLHDGEQIDQGAPCMGCRATLRRVWRGDQMPWGKRSEHPEKATADGWACPRCRRWHTENQYRAAVLALHRTEAAYLTDRDMEIRTGVKAGTVRVWAQRGAVERKRDQGRTVYAVADVEKTAREHGLVS